MNYAIKTDIIVYYLLLNSKVLKYCNQKYECVAVKK